MESESYPLNFRPLEFAISGRAAYSFSLTTSIAYLAGYYNQSKLCAMRSTGGGAAHWSRQTRPYLRDNGEELERFEDAWERAVQTPCNALGTSRCAGGTVVDAGSLLVDSNLPHRKSAHSDRDEPGIRGCSSGRNHRQAHFAEGSFALLSLSANGSSFAFCV